uniref:Uncharacterized protein n=1 Tax=Ananas comosus var. bracteatus TaxID=296719 RepID=A0A6V7QHJ0_ANACO|nr:unnamed protein product [Ananas comosus var. bracteatus]
MIDSRPSRVDSFVKFASLGPVGRAFPLGGRTHWELWSWFSPHVALGCLRFARERRGGARRGRSSVDSALPPRPEIAVPRVSLAREAMAPHRRSLLDRRWMGQVVSLGNLRRAETWNFAS